MPFMQKGTITTDATTIPTLTQFGGIRILLTAPPSADVMVFTDSSAKCQVQKTRNRSPHFSGANSKVVGICRIARRE